MRIFLILALMLLAPGAALAGGYTGPLSGAQAETVAKAKTLSDKAPVVLSGHLSSQVAGSTTNFMFEDATGQIMVSIPESVFGQLEITPQTRVLISGTVAVKLGDPMEIDVVLLKPAN